MKFEIRRCRHYFVSGLWILPYLFGYLLSWKLDVRVTWLKYFFWGLHGLNGTLLLLLAKDLPKFPRRDLIFWSGLALLFLLPGPYLEFPSDPWEHFRRISEWANCGLVRQHDTRYKFAYFWDWTFLSNEYPYVDPGLNLISAFWQLVVCGSVFRLSRALDFSIEWSLVNVLGFVALFGTNLFGIRYYALSSTLLAYTVYLESLIRMLRLEAQKKLSGREACAIGPLILIMAFNHLQTLLFLLVSFSALAAHRIFFGPWRWPRQIRMALGLALALGMLAPWVSHLRYLRLAAPELKVLETIGVSGALGFLGALVYFKKDARLALLIISPLLILCFPLFSSAITAYSHGGVAAYRILFAMPMSFGLVFALRELGAQTRFKKMPAILITATVIIVLGMLPMFPFRGRLWFALHRPARVRTLGDQQIAAQWLYLNRPFPKDCRYITDPHLAWAAAGYLGWMPREDRLVDYPETFDYDTLDHLIWLTKNQKICGFISARPLKLPEVPPSMVAKLSHHWSDSLGSIRWAATEQYWRGTQYIEIMAHWKATDVPPYYQLYEPK